MTRFFTTAHLCELAGVPAGTLKRLRASGSVLAARPGDRGRGHCDLWTCEQVFAIMVARALRKAGVVQEDAEAVLQYLWGMSGRELDTQFASGHDRLMLVVSRERGTRCLPMLLQRAAIFENEVCKKARRDIALG